MRLTGKILRFSLRRRLAVLTTVIVLACAAVIGVIGGRTWGGSDAHATAAIQGPRPAPVTITAASGGSRIVCPRGSVPYVNITAADFTPKLTNGTQFRPGRYRITLSGQVANETTAAIVVDRIAPWTLKHRAWRAAHVTAPLRLSANSSGRLHITGIFHSPGRGQAALGASLHWHWASSRLARCGEKGLIDDD
jgi:hypothetical protein